MYKSVDLVVKLNADLEQHVTEQVVVVVSLLHLGAGRLSHLGRQAVMSEHIFLLVSFSLSQCNVFLSCGWACFFNNKTIQLVAFVSC